MNPTYTYSKTTGSIGTPPSDEYTNYIEHGTLTLHINGREVNYSARFVVHAPFKTSDRRQEVRTSVMIWGMVPETSKAFSSAPGWQYVFQSEPSMTVDNPDTEHNRLWRSNLISQSEEEIDKLVKQLAIILTPIHQSKPIGSDLQAVKVIADYDGEDPVNIG